MILPLPCVEKFGFKSWIVSCGAASNLSLISIVQLGHYMVNTLKLALQEFAPGTVEACCQKDLLSQQLL